MGPLPAPTDVFPNGKLFSLQCKHRDDDLFLEGSVPSQSPGVTYSDRSNTHQAGHSATILQNISTLLQKAVNLQAIRSMIFKQADPDSKYLKISGISCIDISALLPQLSLWAFHKGTLRNLSLDSDKGNRTLQIAQRLSTCDNLTDLRHLST